MKKNIWKLILGSIFTIGIYSPSVAQCTINDATDCECEDPNQTDCDLLPDIQLSWFGIIDVSDGPTEYAQDYNGADAGRLRISASTPNDGYGPLTVRGVADCQEFATYFNQNTSFEGDCVFFECEDEVIIVNNTDVLGSSTGYYCENSDQPAKQITFQRIYHRNSDGTMSYYDRVAGTMTYHPTHGHNHSDDWGVFTLRTMDPNEPDPLNWPIVSDGAKMGFCLMDYGTCGTGEGSTYYGHCRDENRYSPSYLETFPQFNDGTNGGTIKLNSDFPNFGLGGGEYGCSPIEQGISAGWLDLYGEWLEDQWINLEPGLCNGVYWIIGEVDKNNDYLESNEENNWSAVPVTLTQQLDGEGYDIQILSEDQISICNGEIITLESNAPANNSFLWSNGQTTSTIDVSESGEYSLTSTSECGEGESQTVEVIVNAAVESPIVNNVTIQAGEIATLNATADGNIVWQDMNGNVLETGNTYNSEPLFENTTYYVLNENVITESPEFIYTGESQHECDGSGNCDYSGTIYNGGLRFDCNSSFTLNSVTVFTETEGERTIELRNSNQEIINSLTLNIPATGDNGYVINLNWSISEGSDYILTTDENMNNEIFGDNNPLLKRTTGGLATFPFIIENILEIKDGAYDSGDGFGFNEAYYYYFYNWEISNQWNLGEISCVSDVLEVNVLVGNTISGCTDFDACNYNSNATNDDGSCVFVNGLCESCVNGIIVDNDLDDDNACDESDNCPNTYNPEQTDSDNDGLGDECDSMPLAIQDYQNTLSIFPNPAQDMVNINILKNSNNAFVRILNNVGELIATIYTGPINENNNIKFDASMLSSGIYVVHYYDHDSSIKLPFTICH